MSLAKKINIGDTIGFFSPSTPITKLAPKRFKRAQKFIESKGFFLEAGNLTKQNDFYRSGSIKDRANELNQLIRNPKVSCIISTIGGSNSNAILPYIDYQALKNNPKIIIGYSDVTAILLAIYSQINLITFYGPALVASFGEVGNIAEETYRYFENILINPKLNRTIQNPKQWTDEFIDWETQTSEKQTQANKIRNSGQMNLLIGKLKLQKSKHKPINLLP